MWTLGVLPLVVRAAFLSILLFSVLTRAVWWRPLAALHRRLMPSLTTPHEDKKASRHKTQDRATGRQEAWQSCRLTYQGCGLKACQRCGCSCLPQARAMEAQGVTRCHKVSHGFTRRPKVSQGVTRMRYKVSALEAPVNQTAVASAFPVSL